MIVAGQLLIDGGDGHSILRPGFVRVDDGRIAEVIEGEIPRVADVGGEGFLVSPGFIDAHLHLPQFDMIGAHGMPLLRWLSDITFPSEMKWAEESYARDMTKRACSQLLSKGTTAIAAYATVHHRGARAALDVASSIGMRGVIGQVLMDREAPPELCGTVDRLLDEAKQLGESYPATERMAAAITPRFAISCSEELLDGAGRLAAEQGAMVQTHLAETQNECSVVEQLFDGRRYVDVYDSAGLLGERSILGHGIHLARSDLIRLASRRSVIAHCPTANTFLRSGAMNRSEWIDASVRLAVGSDIGAGYERSMVRVARATIETASAIGDDFPDAAAAWHGITAGNADALGWTDAGRLKVGSPADLLVIEPTIPWLGPMVDPLATLLWAWDDRWLKRTMLRGQFVD